jgi:plasmid stabilization system protein ParE
MNIVWTHEAREDLRAIHAFISRDSQIQALKQIDQIRLRVRWIAENPVRGHPVHELLESGCIEVHEGKYRIIHRIKGDEMSIVTVVHRRQMLDLDRLQ